MRYVRLDSCAGLRCGTQRWSRNFLATSEAAAGAREVTAGRSGIVQQHQRCRRQHRVSSSTEMM
eukprot:5439421-Prymnesium_polylepis.1